MPAKKKAGIAATAVGGAALVTGAVFLGLYAHHPEVCDGLSGKCQGKPAYQGIVGVVAGGVGAAALITGIVLMATSKTPENADNHQAVFSISPASGGAMAVFSGRF